jgi:catechol 2,3-dioxygenase-like lactoylglutathione lyase family enzyme
MPDAIGRVHHVGLTVKDMDKSLEWYGRMFGVEPVFVTQAEGDGLATAVGVPGAKLTFAFLRFGETEVELLSYDNDRDENFGRRNCDVGSPHLCLLVDDIEASYQDLKAKGVEFFAEPLHIEGGPLDGCSFVYFRDPDGITLELFEEAKAKS